MPPEITPEEYKQINNRLVKLLALYKNDDITTKQILDKIYDCFFVNK